MALLLEDWRRELVEIADVLTKLCIITILIKAQRSFGGTSLKRWRWCQWEGVCCIVEEKDSRWRLMMAEGVLACLEGVGGGISKSMLLLMIIDVVR